jgi:sec-independent protein translocase protein TatB
MFDLGFPELLMVFVVALVVLGPKRMPGLVKQVGRWVGKARAMARQFREQLESEVNLEELASMEKKRPPAASTPPPPSGLDGEPIPAATDAKPDYGTYPYSEAPPATASTDGNSAQPQPGDDTYSHAHAHGAEPYYPPEAESAAYVSVPPLDAAPGQQELALNDVSLLPDPAAPAVDAPTAEQTKPA